MTRPVTSPIPALVALVLLMPASRPLAQVPAVDLPVTVPDEKWHPLREVLDPDLQSRLETRLRSDARWAALIDRQKLAVGLVDLTDPTAPRFARVNGAVMMYAASLPKIAILLACVQAFEDGSLEETPANLRDMALMIRKSSNTAATRMIREVGGLEKIEKVLTNPDYALYDRTSGGGLWVGKPYAKAGESRRDPMKGLSHAASATQVCRFYYLLATGRLVSPKRSLQMLELMSDPGVHHKFVHTLEEIAPQARLYRKSGTWRTWHSDSVLVWGKAWRRYILVGMVEDARGGLIMENLVHAAEDILRPATAPPR